MSVKLFALVLLFAVATSCNAPEATGANGVTFKDAVAYNDYIIKHQSGIITHILSVADMMSKDLNAAETMLDKGVLITDSALVAVKGMSDFKGDSVFRNRAVANFQFYRKLFTADYRKIVSINKKGEEATAANIAELEALQASIEAEETELDKRLNNAQTDFAKKNKMPLLENEVQKKIDSIE